MKPSEIVQGTPQVRQQFINANLTDIVKQTTYRLEVYGQTLIRPEGKNICLFGDENLTFEQAMAIIEDLHKRPCVLNQEIHLIQE
jgi:hypothetical protein